MLRPSDAALGGAIHERGRALASRARRIIPGGAHTYAKGDDQFPAQAPPVIVRGRGCRVWDADGNQYIEYGMGLRAVTLGHAFAPVVRAVSEQLLLGSNFSRPAPIELECAEKFLELVPTMEMVKFCKDGSTAVDAAIRLARGYTGRDMVAYCGDHPFFSTGDWFISTTGMPCGIPASVRELVVAFRYNDLESVRRIFEQHTGRVAALVLEAARTDDPQPGFLEGLRDLCDHHGTLMIFDEMITGFRWHRSGAQHVYGVTPDLSTFGKAMANGFALSALGGRREFMRLGGFDHDRERVFLLSTTHGAETHALAAGIATMTIYQTEPVIEYLERAGRRLRTGIEECIAARNVEGHVALIGRDSCLLFATRDAVGKPSQVFRTLFLQELVVRGVLAPSFVVSYSHTDEDIDRTIEAADGALRVYRQALEDGPEQYLQGRPVKPVFRPYA